MPDFAPRAAMVRLVLIPLLLAAPSPAPVEVLVVGCPHLLQMDPKDKPATDLIRRRLAEFEPDHVVVEWLHPSIDPASTGNYRPFEDLSVLAQLWGYHLSEVQAAAARTGEVLRTEAKHGLPTAATRVELGKLYYLRRDRLNAGYQWWIAERLGADVGDLKHLTRDNFEGHELEVWGFPIAYGQGLEHITPFDYQGPDAAWIWSDIVGAVMAHALATNMDCMRVTRAGPRRRNGMERRSRPGRTQGIRPGSGNTATFERLPSSQTSSPSGPRSGAVSPLSWVRQGCR